MPVDRKYRIAIDCRIANRQQGLGVSTIALANALSQSNVSHQEYVFIVREDMKDWLAPHIFGPCRLVGIRGGNLSGLKNALRRIAPLRWLWQQVNASVGSVPASDGYVESQQFDLVHFPTQTAYLTSLPTIYQPWDLQHLHYPQFFSKTDYASREKQYRAYCLQAKTVSVQSEWTKRDVVERYGLSPDKVSVITWGCAFDAYQTPSAEQKEATLRKYSLPEQFFFYPAVTWEHKNHAVIIRAIHRLKKERGRMPEVFFTGASTPFRTNLDRLASELGVSNQLHYLGFVDPIELQVIFNAATAMIFASKFEGFGQPILEAFHSGLPVLSSNTSTLPEIASDGALYFDPDDDAELALLMERMLDDPSLRRDMIRRGSLLLPRYSIKNMAVNFQALYDRIINSDDENKSSSLSSASASIG